MFALFSSFRGYEDAFIVAVFTTKEKAETVLVNIKDHFPTECFYIGEYIPPKIDPTFEEIIWEGISDERASDEGEALLQHRPQGQHDTDDLRRFSEL